MAQMPKFSLLAITKIGARASRASRSSGLLPMASMIGSVGIVNKQALINEKPGNQKQRPCPCAPFPATGSSICPAGRCSESVIVQLAPSSATPLERGAFEQRERGDAGGGGGAGHYPLNVDIDNI